MESDPSTISISLPPNTPPGTYNLKTEVTLVNPNLSDSSDSDFEFEENETRFPTGNVSPFQQDVDSSTKSLSITMSSDDPTTSSSCSTKKPQEWDESSHTIKTVQGEQQSYWKINFLVALLPLVLCGFPIHLLLWGRRGISNPKQWFKQIFLKDPITMRLLTLGFFIIGLGLNGFFFSISGTLLHSLIIKGEVRSNIFTDLINILRLAPLIIPLDLLWIWGYTARKLLLSFDRVTYPEVEIRWSKSTRMDKSNKLPSEQNWKNGWRNMPPYRLYFLGMYLLILFYQCIQLLITLEYNKHLEVDTNSARIIEGWSDFILIFMYNLMLPIYICVVWAIQFEFERLSLYIKSLIACRVHPDFEYLAQFKKYYKDVGNHVMAVNDICSIYYSWVLLILYSSMYDEVFGVVQVIFEAIVSSIVRSEGLEGGNELSAVDVRLFAANFFGGVAELIILGLTVWFCITANDQARNLHVRLNDFISEPYVVLTPELYKKFRMLKYYIHSRMETEKPALLNISIVSALPYCRCIYDWKVGYRVRH